LILWVVTVANINKEIIAIKKDLEKLTTSKTKPLIQAYKRALDETRKEVGAIVLKYTKEGAISVSKIQRYSILKSLQKQLQEQIKDLGGLDEKITTHILEKVYSESYYKTAYTIDKGIEAGLDFSILKPEMVKSAVFTPIEGKMFSDRIWDNKDVLVKRVRRDVEKVLINGESPEHLARVIKKDFGVSAYESKRLINTEVARMTSTAQDEIYKSSDVVKKVMWDATLDSKTSEICENYNGKIWDANSNHPIPPVDSHPNCRCSLVPVIDDWKPTKKLDNETKKVEDYKSFSDWKKSKGI